MKYSRMVLATVVLLSCLAADRTTAITYDWDNGGAGDSWSTSANWDPNGTPGGGDTINLTDTFVTGPQTIDLDGLTRSVEEIRMTGVNGSFTFTNGTLEILSNNNGLLHNSGVGVLQVDADMELATTNDIARFNVVSGADQIIVNGDIESSAASGTTRLELTSRDLSLDPSVLVTGVISDGTSGAALSLIAGFESDSLAHAGTVEVTGLNTYTGQTLVNGVVLRFNSIANVGGGASALGAPTTVGTGTIRLGAVDTISGPTGPTSGTLVYTGSGHSSNRAFELIGAGGAIKADSSATGGLTLSGQVSATTSGLKTFELGGDSEPNTFNTYSGAMLDGTGQVELVKTGSSTWVLIGTKGYTGPTHVEQGTLQIGTGGAGRLNDATVVTVDPNATIRWHINSADAIFGLNGAGTVDLIDSDLVIGNEVFPADVGGIGTFTGTMTGNTGGGLTKRGTGTFTFAGVGTYGDLTRVEDGQMIVTGSIDGTSGVTLSDGPLAGGSTLTIDGGSLTTPGTTTMAAGTTVTLTGGGSLTTAGLDNSSDGTLNFNDGTLRITGTSSAGTTKTINWLAGGGEFDIADPSHTFTLNQALGGTGGLTKSGPGTLKLTNESSSYSGDTTVTAGTLAVETMDFDGAVPDGSRLVVEAAGRFEVAGIPQFETVDSIAGDGEIALGFGLRLLGNSHSSDFAGVISGAGALSIIGGSHTLSGSNTYQGVTSISGTLNVSADNNLGSPGVPMGFSGGTLGITGTSFTSTSRPITWSGGEFDIVDPNNTFTVNVGSGGSGDLTKLGLGTLQLDGDNDYSGETTIDEGELQLLNGSTLMNASGQIAFDPGSTGAVTIAGVDPNSGTRSTWTNSGDLRVGGSGSGKLDITGGGLVENSIAFIGSSASSTGAVTIADVDPNSGTRSTWTISSDLRVGDAGSGTLDITGGGLVTTTLGGTIGLVSGSTGAVTIAGVDPNSGTRSTWTNSGYLFVGDAGSGTLDITAGGLVENTNGHVGGGFSSTSVVTVDGTDPNGNPSTWDNSGELYVGTSSGDGALEITAGGLVENTDGYIGESFNSTGVVTVDGTDPNGNPSTWNNSGELYVGVGSGEGTLNVAGGGLVEMTTGYVGYATTSKGGTSPKGLVTVAGADPNSGTRSTWHSSGDLFVGNSSLFSLSAGTYSINDGGMVLVDGELKIWSNGTVNLLGGTIDVVTLDLTDPGNTFSMTGGRLKVETVEGDLTIVGGTLAPGDSPGLTTITGNYIQETGATLEIEIGSTEFGDFDRLEISGTAMLGGTLKIVPVDTGSGVYQPQAGDSIGFLAAQLGAGDMFDAFDWPDLGPHLEWQINPGGVTVFLQVQPTLPGDFDLDFDVDGEDFLLWQIDPNVGNLSDWEANYGTVLLPPLAAASKAVPEPSGLLLALAALCVASIKRRR